MTSSPRRLPGAALLLLGALVATAASPRDAHAQRLGFEAGIAGAENQEVAPALGLSASLPFTDRLRAVGSYTRWAECDEIACEGRGYGNEGVNLLALYRLLGSRALNASVGGGMGWYERFQEENGATDHFWEEALTFAGEVRRPVAFNSDLYLRGEISFPTDDRAPRWGLLRVGVDVGVF